MNRNPLLESYPQEEKAPHSADYVTGPVVEFCRQLGARRILDVGCGNGALCGVLVKNGFEATGCEPTEKGVALAREAFPQIRFLRAGIDDDELAAVGGDFDVVIATEVIEHLYLPGALPRFARRVLRPGGHLILSTPYHGYLKNLVISVLGKWDSHFGPLWDGGHVKFWSRRTLSQLLGAAGFTVTDFMGVGRFPYLWKSMIMVARKD
jgi:2-polyprenyl-3-methyl-5-hydroxy-6-metoxy-1,4-benzoquinol methylase